MRNDQRRAWVEVDLGALSNNAAFIMARARTPLLPMVKADAYGLGVGPVVQALEALDPWGYGVATLTSSRRLATTASPRRWATKPGSTPGTRQAAGNGTWRSTPG
jgi:alanine racemase